MHQFDSGHQAYDFNGEKWRIVKMLGSGYRGDRCVSNVYLVGSETGKSAALKVEEICEVADNIFSQEAAVLKRLGLLHHAQVDGDIGQYGTRLILMPCIAGQTLYQCLETQVLSRAEILRIAHEICAALQRVHNSNVLHRDLWAENILISKGPDGFVASIIDFGLALLTESPVSETVMAKPRALPSMRAPEISFTQEEYSKEKFPPKPHTDKIDIYALGLVFFRDLNLADLSFVAAMLSTEPSKRPTLDQLMSSFELEYQSKCSEPMPELDKPAKIRLK